MHSSARQCPHAPGLAIRPWRVQAELCRLHASTRMRLHASQGRGRPLPSELLFPPADAAADHEPLMHVPHSHPAQGAASRKQQGGSGLEAGIQWPSPDESPPFWERPARTAPAPLRSGSSRSPQYTQIQDPLQIFHMTAEMAPLAKVGGLGDVVLGLARTCHLQGHKVRVMLPFYECLPEGQLGPLQHERDFDVPKGRVWDGRMQTETLRTSAWTGEIEGVPVTLLRPDWGRSSLFRGGAIYGGSHSELEAYLYFSRACLEYIAVAGLQPDIIHVHEWQLSAVPMLYWDHYHKQGLTRPRVMLTIHNMDSAGECRQDEFAYSGLPGEMFASPDKALDERTIGHNPERLSLMKGGIVYSNVITTVSPTYARQSVAGGAAGWLNSTLARPDVRAKFHGILNGIDTVSWDPAADPTLPANFSTDQFEGKDLCKRYLQQGLGLDLEAGKPLVVCVTRLVPQKGIHLIRHAVHRTAEQGGQFVLLGSGHADGAFRHMAQHDFHRSKDVRLLIMYSEALSHLIYAAADVVLVPSMFEPCGLTQMIAHRYGAVPVVRLTGGLVDTVTDVDAGSEQGNGYCFDGVDEASLNSALDRALQAFREKPDWWALLCRRNMQIDWSWEQSAAKYNELYSASRQW